MKHNLLALSVFVLSTTLARAQFMPQPQQMPQQQMQTQQFMPSVPMPQQQVQGFAAPQQQMVGEQSAFTSGGNGCTTVRYDNTRMQNGQLMPASGGVSGGFHVGG